MAEQSKPNTFGGGMVTDLDPGYQPKDTYFTGLNIRVITNGDNSYSLENIQGPKLEWDLNTALIDGQPAFASNTGRYVIHGAVIVDDYVITIEGQLTSSGKNWKIRKYTIDSQGDLSIDGALNSHLWAGAGLFSDNAGEIEMESIVESENIHRIYCTDGLTVFKSINVKEDISSLSVSDFEVFKPNIMASASISNFTDGGGNLLCGSYSYVYRFYTENQSNYSDWSPMSRAINVPINDVVGNDSLTIKGGTGSDVSSHTIKVSITGIPTNYTNIEVAQIHFVAANINTIHIIERAEIAGTTHEFVHSGFETKTLVEGGIADVLIKNNVWDTCKSLAQKENRLYASNLDHSKLSATYKSIDDLTSLLDTYKVKSYKAVWSSGSHSSFSAQTGAAGFNEHRHKKCYNLTSPELDATSFYKFIPKNYHTSGSPRYILGAETPGYTNSDNDGFRITFQHVSYPIDEHATNSEADFATTEKEVTSNQDRYYNVPFKVSATDANYLNSVKGPINPKWDNEFRSFRRGECYRFGIILIDKNGLESFVYHIGDVKMPDGNDPNYWKLNAAGSNEEANNTSNNAPNNWAPFSMPDSDSGGAEYRTVTAHALIPRIDVRLPSSITSIISGYRIVRAEVSDEDKVMITQGLASDVFKYDSTNTSSTINDLYGVGWLPNTRLYISGDQNGAVTGFASGHQSQLRNQLTSGNSGMLLDTPDVTIGGKNYLLSSGYKIQPSYLMVARGSVGNYQERGIIIYDGLSQTDSALPNGIHSGLYKYSPVKFSSDFTEFTAYSGDNAQFANVAVSLNQLGSSHDGTQINEIVKNTVYVKTVVNGEIVSSTDTGWSANFINKAAMDGDGDPTDESSIYSLGVKGNGPLRGNDIIGSSTKLLISIDGNWVNCGAFKNTNTGNRILIGDDDNVDWDYTSPIGSDDYPTVGWSKGKWVVDLVRNTDNGSGGTNFEQYGGSGNTALQNTRYISCSEFTPVSSFSSQVSTINIGGGDTFCDMYTSLSTFKESSSNNVQSFGIAIPLESPYNLGYRSGSYYGSSLTAVTTQEDSYQYNFAYHQAINTKGYVQQPSGFNSNNRFKNKIVASQVKIAGEPQDAWSSFLSNDFIELPLNQGEIVDILNYRNNLYSIQSNGVSLISINPRVLIQGEGAAADIQIVSGTGTVMERYDYLTTQYGSRYYNKSITTPTGAYFLDKEKSEILKLSEKGVNPISLTNSYKNHIVGLTKDKTILSSENNNLGSLTQGLFTGYDSEFRECYFTIVDSSNAKNSFIISDLDGKLISTLQLRSDATTASSIFFKKYISYNNRLFGVSHETATNSNDSIYLFNSDVYQHFNVGFVVNDNAAVSKIFDTSEIISDTASSFTSHTLSDSIGTNATAGSNERIREGIHRVSLRGANTDRARGTWLKHTINYNQVEASSSIDASNDKKFNIFAVNTRYRQSR